MSELDRETRAFLEEALAADRPRAEDRQRVRALLTARLEAPPAPDPSAASAPAPGVSAAAGGGGVAGLGTWITALTAAGLISGAGLYALRGPAPGERPAEPAALAPAEPAPPRAPPHDPEPSSSADAPSATHSADDAPPAERRPTRPRRADPTVAPRAAPSPLEEEARLLGEARAALRDEDPRRALSLVEQHAARFPAGALVAERWTARGLALCALGRVEEARRARAHLAELGAGAAILARLDEACRFRAESDQ